MRLHYCTCGPVLALLWEDHLLCDSRLSDDLAVETGSFSDYGGVNGRANAVFMDLQTKRVKPGSPQLDYHINGKNGGVYSNMTDEKDIVDLIEERKKSSGYDAGQRRRDELVLERRERLLGEADKRDSQFRSAHSFEIREAK